MSSPNPPSRRLVSHYGFRAGFKKSLPVIASAAPFGILFGALAVENGFTIIEAVMMSAIVFAGASQMVGINLFGQQIAPWLIVLSIFAVNFRHVLYSAALTRHIGQFPFFKKYLALFLLTDPQFAETELQGQRHPPVNWSWYMGLAVPIYVLWVAETFIGAWFGGYINAYSHLGIDFFLPIYFLGLVMGFRQRTRWLPVVVVSGASSTVALHLLGSPWHVSVGAIAGISAAAMLYKPEPVQVLD